jgi:hypothetical protein
MSPAQRGTRKHADLVVPAISTTGYSHRMGDDAREDHMRFPQQDSGVPTTQGETTEPEEPSRAGFGHSDSGGAGSPDPSPSVQSGVPSEGVSESTPGDGL